MKISTERSSWTQAQGDWLVVFLAEGEELAGPVRELDEALRGVITRLRERKDFNGRLGETCVLPDVPMLAAKRVLLAGLGNTDSLTTGTFYRAAVTAIRALTSKETARIAIGLPTVAPAQLPVTDRAALLATAAHVASVGQDKLRTVKKRFVPGEVVLLTTAVSEPEAAGCATAAQQGAIVGEAINLARELVNAPAQDMYPETFARRAEELAGPLGLSCKVLDQPALEAERMQSLLAVSAGSDRDPRLVMLEYKGSTQPQAKKLALVGKGVTFDSGGLSLKTTDQMLTMKCDMAGAATVLASIVAIAKLKLPVNVIALMGLVENMTGGLAMKLGDVLTARSGVTIEVLNTDAEGRLVLADVLDYAVSQGADAMVDLATLTGACVVALGEDVVGAMSNNQPLCDQVLAAARAQGEDIWQLPMYDMFDKMIEGDTADIKNSAGRWGGAITAAKFLERFVKGKPWVHLDIAGPAFASGDKPHREGGGTGCMVRGLIELARRWS